MRDPDLAALLASPALDLEPPADLLEGVRRGARRARRRRAAGATALGLLLVAGTASLVPALDDGRGDDDRVGQLAAGADPRVPEATTAVVVLEELNGGEVVTYFRGNRWCTASLRAGRNDACSRGVGATVPPFAFASGLGTASLSIDDDGLVAGLLGTGVERVEVRLSDGSRPYTAGTVSADGFARPVWWLRVPRGATVEELTAYDAAGAVVARR